MTRTILKIAASALAISAASSAYAQSSNSEQVGLVSMTCAQFMDLDATGMRTSGLEFKSFSGTDIDPNGQMSDTSGDTVVVDSSGTTFEATPDTTGTTVLGTTEPMGDTEIVDSSGTSDPATPNAMADMADDEVVPFILTACEGQPDTLVVTALQTE